jgi:crossover junction endodeoxyribonuclease RuvC
MLIHSISQSKHNSRIILGIDPGSHKMGYGVLKYVQRQPYYLASGVIASKGSLAVLFTELQTIIRQYKPTEAAVEQIFFHQHARSALVLGQARGVALLALELAHLPITGYAARSVKQTITGYGNATKTQMQQMIQKLLHLSAIPRVDAADALSVALCHIYHHNIQYD